MCKGHSQKVKKYDHNQIILSKDHKSESYTVCSNWQIHLIWLVQN